MNNVSTVDFDPAAEQIPPVAQPASSPVIRRRNFLIKAALSCRLCSRSPGDLIGTRNRPWTEARFLANPNALPPRRRGASLRCAHCGGRLYLDEVEELGQGVPLSEIRGPSLGEVIAGSNAGLDATEVTALAS